MPADAIREERLALRVHGELDAGRVAVDQLGCGGRPGPGEPGDGSGDDGNTTHSWPHLLIDGYPIRLELEPRSCAEMSLVGSGFDDLRDLCGGLAKLLVGVVVVRPEPDSGVWTEVAEDLPFG